MDSIITIFHMIDVHDYQESCLLHFIHGNCLNNNTAVYCIILGNTLPHNVTGPLTIWKIQGSSVYSLYFEAIKVSFIHMHVSSIFIIL